MFGSDGTDYNYMMKLVQIAKRRRHNETTTIAIVQIHFIIFTFFACTYIRCFQFDSMNIVVITLIARLQSV